MTPATKIAEQLAALRDGRVSLESVAADFRQRHWRSNRGGEQGAGGRWAGEPWGDDRSAAGGWDGYTLEDGDNLGGGDRDGDKLGGRERDGENLAVGDPDRHRPAAGDRYGGYRDGDAGGRDPLPDPGPGVPGSIDEITAAYDRGDLTREEYRVLAHAVAEAVNAEDR